MTVWPARSNTRASAGTTTWGPTSAMRCPRNEDRRTLQNTSPFVHRDYAGVGQRNGRTGQGHLEPDRDVGGPGAVGAGKDVVERLLVERASPRPRHGRRVGPGHARAVGRVDAPGKADAVVGRDRDRPADPFEGRHEAALVLAEGDPAEVRRKHRAFGVWEAVEGRLAGAVGADAAEDQRVGAQAGVGCDVAQNELGVVEPLAGLVENDGVGRAPLGHDAAAHAGDSALLAARDHDELEVGLLLDASAVDEAAGPPDEGQRAAGARRQGHVLGGAG